VPPLSLVRAMPAGAACNIRIFNFFGWRAFAPGKGFRFGRFWKISEPPHRGFRVFPAFVASRRMRGDQWSRRLASFAEPLPNPETHVTNIPILLRASSILRSLHTAATAAASACHRLNPACWIAAAVARRQAGLAIVAVTIAVSCMTDAAAEQVAFQSNGFMLHGCLLLPQGRGPFPTIIFNHGSEKNPEPCGPPALASAYLSRGYIFFTFQRHGHGASPGPYIRDLQEDIWESNQDPKAKERQIVMLQDRSRVAMTGISFGGIQTLLAAEKGLSLRAFVAFAPAAQSWRNRQLQQRLITATRNARAPLFLAQAENDYSLGPSQVLGSIIQGKGFPNAARVYPPFGTTPQQGHWAFAATAAGISIWGPDVFAFLRDVMGPIAPAMGRSPAYAETTTSRVPIRR
jgi:carboxymethylenebutenolidase